MGHELLRIPVPGRLPVDVPRDIKALPTSWNL